MGYFMAILMLTQILWTRDGMGYRHFETKPYESKIMIWICLKIGCPQIHWFIIIVPIDEHGFWGNAAFSPNLALNCWCQEGDLYDPAGTITGGSAPKGGNTLMKLQELFGAESMKYGSTGDTIWDILLYITVDAISLYKYFKCGNWWLTRNFWVRHGSPIFRAIFSIASDDHHEETKGWRSRAWKGPTSRISFTRNDANTTRPR